MKQEKKWIIFLAALVLASGIFIPVAGAVEENPGGGNLTPDVSGTETNPADDDCSPAPDDTSRTGSLNLTEDSPEFSRRHNTSTVPANNTGTISGKQSAVYAAGGPAPVADFTATPLTGPAPLAVQFNDTSAGSPYQWSWNFGDE